MYMYNFLFERSMKRTKLVDIFVLFLYALCPHYLSSSVTELVKIWRGNRVHRAAYLGSIFVFSTEDWIQGLLLARQIVHHWAMSWQLVLSIHTR